jgi:ABC-2 type transport system ATP-binding protein
MVEGLVAHTGTWAADARRGGAAVARMAAVTKQYGAYRALDGLTLELKQGEIVALLGPNGAGKTTAVRILLGLTRPSAGEVQVWGCSPQERKGRARTGAMLQIGRVPEMLTVREHLLLQSGYYARPLPLAEALALGGLTPIANKLFGELSGGQKQRVLFALALCGDPDLVFLDEPTLGMDIEARRALWAGVRALAERGKTVLLTTHYLPEAEALAHRVLVLAAGKLIAEGTPEELKSRGSSATVRCRTTVPVGVLRALPGVLDADKEGNAAEIRTAQPEQLLRALLPLDAQLGGLEVSGTAFEDAFLQLVAASKEEVRA